MDVAVDMRAEVGMKGVGTSTFYHGLINCVSLLYGLGILSSPYAVANAGWFGVAISLSIAVTYWYSSVLVCKCMAEHSHLQNYQDVAEAAFGKRGRLLITILFYTEIFGTLVGYTISIGDNLAHIFPHLQFSIPGLAGRNLLIFLAALIILPTVWFRDLSALSFTTVWSVLSTLVLLSAVLLAAMVDEIGFRNPIPLIHVTGVPVAAGLYAFSYGGTAVFPTVYKSMKDPNTFVKVTVLSFAIGTLSIAGLGVVGAYMFGSATKSQITLNMPSSLLATKIVLWMTVVTPIAKFALILSPVTNELESLFPWNKPTLITQPNNVKPLALFHHFLATLMRSLLLAAIVIVAMALPYFHYIAALIGSSMTIMICMILPCLFYLKIFYKSLHLPHIGIILVIIAFGVCVAITGTIVSVHGLIQSKSATTIDN